MATPCNTALSPMRLKLPPQQFSTKQSSRVPSGLTSSFTPSCFIASSSSFVGLALRRSSTLRPPTGAVVPVRVNAGSSSASVARVSGFRLKMVIGYARNRLNRLHVKAYATNPTSGNTSVELGDFFKGKLPEKFLKVLGLLALSRVGTYIPLAGVNREAFTSSLDTNSILGTLDTFSGGGIGRLGISSLGIVPYINAQIVFQLLGTVFPKLQELQRKEGQAGRNKVKQWTRYASVGFAVVQAVGQITYIRPYVNDFSVEWVLSSIAALVLGSVVTIYIGEKLSDYKLGNGTSLLIFTNIVSYLPASVGRTVVQALNDSNYLGLLGLIVSFFLLVLGIVYVQEAERKIPINYASRYSASRGGLRKSAYLPFKVNSTGVMPIIFSTSLLQLPVSVARFTGIQFLKDAALLLYPGGALYVPTNVLLIGFFNYFYTFLQLDPADLSDQLKRQGASIPAIRPGKATGIYIQNVLGRISVLGSGFLGVMAAAPALVEGVTHLTAFRGFAGTSILILVGCATDTARKVQAELVSQKYKTIQFYEVDDNSDVFR